MAMTASTGPATPFIAAAETASPRPVGRAGRGGLWGSDGWRNGSELWVATHLALLWHVLQRTPVLRSAANRLIVTRFVHRNLALGPRLPTGRRDGIQQLRPSARSRS